MSFNERKKETLLGEIPKSWKIKKVQELVDEEIILKPKDGNHGGDHPTSSDYVDNGIPFIMANDIKNSRIDYNNCKFITKEQADDLRKGFAIEGDVLITHKGTIGRTTIVDNIKTEYIMLTPQVTYYRVKNNNKINNKFLKYFFDYYQFQELLRNWSGSGSTRAYLGITAQRKLPVIIPPIKEQKNIVKVLNALDKKIDNNNKMNKTLEEMAQAIYKNWFVDFEPFEEKEFIESELGLIPKNWKVGSINDFVKVQNGYGFSSKLFSNKGSIGIIKIKNITDNNTVNISDTQYISKETAEDTNNRYLIKSNSILIAMTGAKVGKIGIVPETNTTLYLNQRVGMLKPKIDGGIEYSYIALMTDYYQNVIKNKARGSAQANISATAIGSIKVVIPPKKILKKYANIIKPILNKISSNLNQNQSLKELRDSLLPKLMSGEIRVSLDEEAKEVN